MKKFKPFRVVGFFSAAFEQAFENGQLVSRLTSVSVLTERGRREQRLSGPAFVSWLEARVAQTQKFVPVIAGQGVLKQLWSVLPLMRERWQLRPLAQSSRAVYVLDCCDENGEPLLRLWDLEPLQEGGTEVLKTVAGLPESYSACESMRGFLRWLLACHPELKPTDLGFRVLTKTSLVRLFGQRTVGELRSPAATKKSSTVYSSYLAKCREEAPRSWDQYALRKAAFRGGLAFTAASEALKLSTRVASYDVTSMHHTFISGRMLPVGFAKAGKPVLEAAAKAVLATSMESILDHYEKPFSVAFHARLTFTGLRPRKGSVFERQGIALLAKAKLAKSTSFAWGQEANSAAITAVQEAGLGDQAKGATFAFGKLVSAKEATLALSELELWCLAQAYEWTSMEAVEGELTTKFVLPPDYTILLDSALYSMKAQVKQLLAARRYGREYEASSEFIPEAIAKSTDVAFLESYYQSSIKVLFNSLYGIQAQDPWKPSFTEDFDLRRERPTFSSAERAKAKGLFTYGLRIAGGSRLHLVLAMLLVENALGSKVAITGGDTDSLKIALHAEPAEAVLAALEPLLQASQRAIQVACSKAAAYWPGKAGQLPGVGGFELEGEPAELHEELWTKARASVHGGKLELTCAGLAQPLHGLGVAEALQQLAAKYGWERVLTEALGYGLIVDSSLSWQQGEQWGPEGSCVVSYPMDRELGSYSSLANMESLRAIGATPLEERRLSVSGGKALLTNEATGEVIMEG